MKSFIKYWYWYGRFDPQRDRYRSFSEKWYNWFWYPQWRLMGLIRKHGYMATKPGCYMRWRDFTFRRSNDENG